VISLLTDNLVNHLKLGQPLVGCLRDVMLLISVIISWRRQVHSLVVEVGVLITLKVGMRVLHNKVLLGLYE
jgi:hypothetical protein